MSGHSKWATIHRKKEKTDAARGAVFTRIGREVMMAAREGADPNGNAKLRDAISKAKAANIPNDNIQRWIKRASGEGGAANFEEITYEGRGTQGVSVIVETMTDNRNRTAADMRHYFDKYGGALGTNGSVAWQFDKKGVIVIEKTDEMDDDEMMMIALDAGAEDFVANEDSYEITTDPDSFSEVREALEQQGYEFLEAEVEMVPQTTIALDAEAAAKFQKMLDLLEEDDDVQAVYHNAEMPEDF